MLDRSEFSATPARVLIHDPTGSSALVELEAEAIAHCNFLELPDAAKLAQEYAGFRAALGERVEVVSLADILGDDEGLRAEIASNPNLMFMRDSSVTLPWAPELFIPARLKLPSRAREPELAARALIRLGLTSTFEFEGDEYLEGGDVLPVMQDGMRILLIGFGVRTTKAAALRLARELIPCHVDQVIGLWHDPDLLHLDTGFTVLPNQVMLAAAGMFHAGFLVDETGREQAIDPIVHAESLGFHIVRVQKADAIAHERCNLLPLGEGRFLAFEMPQALRSELEARAGISITCVPGAEIAKATGGVHCLTRPVYL